MSQITDGKKPAQEAGSLVGSEYLAWLASDAAAGWARSVVNGSRSGLGFLGGVLGHDIHDGGNLAQASEHALWREAIFGSELGQKLGEDDLMLQWLYAACVLKSSAPGLKGDLKRLVSEVATFLGSLFQPRRRYRWERPHKDAAQREQAVDDGRVEWCGHGGYSSRPDALIIRVPRNDPANETDVVW